jgi:hypothetical protein
LVAVSPQPVIAVEEPAFAQRRMVFSHHDLNRDGYIDRREYYRFRQRIHARRGPGQHGVRLYAFQELDRDGDGRVDCEELLERLDSDRD